MNIIDFESQTKQDKIGDEFDQDEVHIRDNNVDLNVEPLVLQSDGTFNTPIVAIKFTGAVPFKEITTNPKYNIQGATIIENNALLLYQAELPIENGKTAEQTANDFYNAINQIKNDYKGSIRATQESYTRLRRYSRNGREGVSASYKQAISNLRPLPETRKRPEGKHPEQIKLVIV